MNSNIKASVWAHRYGMSAERLKATLGMTHEEAYDNFMRHWEQESEELSRMFPSRLPSKTIMFSTPGLRDSFIEKHVSPTFEPRWELWKDPLAITKVAEAVGTNSLDLIKHKSENSWNSP